jgi:hypothetical protein
MPEEELSPQLREIERCMEVMAVSVFMDFSKYLLDLEEPTIQDSKLAVRINNFVCDKLDEFKKGSER